MWARPAIPTPSHLLLIDIIHHTVSTQTHQHQYSWALHHSHCHRKPTLLHTTTLLSTPISHHTALTKPGHPIAPSGIHFQQSCRHNSAVLALSDTAPASLSSLQHSQQLTSGLQNQGTPCTDACALSHSQHCSSSPARKMCPQRILLPHQCTLLCEHLGRHIMPIQLHTALRYARMSLECHHIQQSCFASS
jgi:hypothetical protein